MSPSPGFRVVWGVSANTRGRVSLREGHEIGYFPVDNAENYAQDLASNDQGITPTNTVGGPYSAPDLE